MRQIRILLADDKPLILEGLNQLLKTQEDIEVVGEASLAVEAVALAGELLPDVVLLDITMPHMAGIEAVPLIKKASPETSIVVLTMHNLEAYILEVFQAGAVGYILKTTPASQVLQAIRLAASGKYFIQPDIRSSAVDSYLWSIGAELPDEKKSHRVSSRRKYAN